MKRSWVLIILLAWGSLCAQQDEKYVQQLADEFTAKLAERGIQNYFSATFYCMGNIQMFRMNDGSMCSSKGTYVETYVFWTESDDEAWVKKMDNCGLFLSVQLEDNSLLSLVQERQSDLEQMAVKPFETEDMKEGVPSQRTSIHNCIRAYDFHLETKMFQQEFNTMAFIEASKDDTNLNYEYNSQLAMFGVNAQCEALVKALDADGQFKRM